MRLPRFLLALGLAATPVALAAQAAVDPAVAPRAVALDRAGRRVEAMEMLGRYLATAPDDAAGWLQLGRFYLLDSRAWHTDGHRGDPAGGLYLDFAATALDQSLRRPTDSALVLRAMIEMDRARAGFEASGWSSMQERLGAARAADLPPFVLELGHNLILSCPARGVLVTGSDLEALAAWAAWTMSSSSLFLFDPALYRTDSLYRRQSAAELGTDTVLAVGEALAMAARDRPICLTPLSDPGVIPGAAARAVRLVRLAGVGGPLAPDGVTVVELLSADLGSPNGLTHEALELYRAAARRNQLLCRSLLAQLGPQSRDGCGSP